MAYLKWLPCLVFFEILNSGCSLTSAVNSAQQPHDYQSQQVFLNHQPVSDTPVLAHHTTLSATNTPPAVPAFGDHDDCLPSICYLSAVPLETMYDDIKTAVAHSKWHLVQEDHQAHSLTVAADDQVPFKILLASHQADNTQAYVLNDNGLFESVNSFQTLFPSTH